MSKIVNYPKPISELGKRFQPTGEFRPPRAGEWYIAQQNDSILYRHDDHSAGPGDGGHSGPLGRNRLIVLDTLAPQALHRLRQFVTSDASPHKLIAFDQEEAKELLELISSC